MIRVGLLSFSDGRERVHDTLKSYIELQRDTLACELEKTSEVQVAYPDFICSSNDKAREAARWLMGQNIDVCLFNVPVFAFPNFSSLAARLLRDYPIIAIAPVNGSLPGLGGLQAAVGAIRQSGGQCAKTWGNIDEPQTLGKVMAFLRGAYAASRLKGQVLGLYGGRSIGMVSGTASPDVYMNKFGVDIDHVDEGEIIRRASLIPPDQTQHAMQWLVKHLGQIEYDGDKLTEESLAWQVNCYIALKQLIKQRGHDFVGVKCHYDLSEYFVTQCISAALSNDPYDWDGEKETVVFSCEADIDAALTMQVLKLVSGKPVLFMDFRHYMQKENLLVLCNCGASATYYAGLGTGPEDNLAQVRLCPVIQKYGGKGAHVQYIAAEGQMTFARLTHRLDSYVLQVFEGHFENVPQEMLEATSSSWPHGYARIAGDPMKLIERFESNHIHAVSGSYLKELEAFASLKNIEFELLS